MASAGRAVLTEAMKLDFGDYEDALQHEAARLAGADLIVTRNPDDFEQATLSVYHPVALIEVLNAEG